MRCSWLVHKKPLHPSISYIDTFIISPVMDPSIIYASILNPSIHPSSIHLCINHSCMHACIQPTNHPPTKQPTIHPYIHLSPIHSPDHQPSTLQTIHPSIHHLYTYSKVILSPWGTSKFRVFVCQTFLLHQCLDWE